MKEATEQLIFSKKRVADHGEWGYLRKGKFQRRDFRFDALTQSSAFSEEGSLFAQPGVQDIFTRVKTYPPMNLRQLAEQASMDKGSLK